MVSLVDSEHATKAYGRVEVYFHSFLATALDTGGGVHVPIFSHKEEDPLISNEQDPGCVPEPLWNLCCKEISLLLSESETWFLGCPGSSLDTIPNELTRLDLAV
jgi:hypothetical protein